MRGRHKDYARKFGRLGCCGRHKDYAQHIPRVFKHGRRKDYTEEKAQVSAGLSDDLINRSKRSYKSICKKSNTTTDAELQLDVFFRTLFRGKGEHIAHCFRVVSYSCSVVAKWPYTWRKNWRIFWHSLKTQIFFNEWASTMKWDHVFLIPSF